MLQVITTLVNIKFEERFLKKSILKILRKRTLFMSNESNQSP